MTARSTSHPYHDLAAALQALSPPKKSKATEIGEAIGAIIGSVAVIIGLSFLEAQLVVWGLSLYHVNSGLWGPLLLLGVLESVLIGAARRKS